MLDPLCHVLPLLTNASLFSLRSFFLSFITLEVLWFTCLHFAQPLSLFFAFLSQETRAANKTKTQAQQTPLASLAPPTPNLGRNMKHFQSILALFWVHVGHIDAFYTKIGTILETFFKKFASLLVYFLNMFLKVFLSQFGVVFDASGSQGGPWEKL